jgi:hypothetical protein
MKKMIDPLTPMGYDAGWKDAYKYIHIYEDRIDKAMDLISQYGQIDGSHHKAWVLDQVARILKAGNYEDWVKKMLGEIDEEGDTEYEYDEGICP